MTQVYFTEQALSDLERIFKLLEQETPEFSIAVGNEIVDGTSVLRRHPLIGRLAPHNLREGIAFFGPPFLAKQERWAAAGLPRRS